MSVDDAAVGRDRRWRSVWNSIERLQRANVANTLRYGCQCNVVALGQQIQADVGKGHQDERSLKHPSVRHNQTRLVDSLPVNPQDIDIKRTRAPVHDPHALRRGLPLLADTEEFSSRKISIKMHHEVKERTLIRPANRVRLIRVRHRHDIRNRRHCFSQVGRTITNVRTKSEEGAVRH